jgi:hypothetical protein
MSKSFPSRIMLWRMQQQITASSRKRTCEFVFKSNSPNIFFKMLKEFSTTLLPQHICLSNNASNIVWWAFATCLWGIMSHGSRGYLYPHVCKVQFFFHHLDSFRTTPHSQPCGINLKVVRCGFHSSS